mgnify:FL=1|jgi:hypothetical protein|tara:strand:- start:731 stop:967 length:237 start_codon:yes stop_codon:yes gene_type:complete
MFNKSTKGKKMKTWFKIKINGDDVWTQTPKETKSWYDKLNKLKGDDLRLEIAKPFLPNKVLKMTKKNQINYINKWERA